MQSIHPLRTTFKIRTEQLCKTKELEKNFQIYESKKHCQFCYLNKIGHYIIIRPKLNVLHDALLGKDNIWHVYKRTKHFYEAIPGYASEGGDIIVWRTVNEQTLFMLPNLQALRLNDINYINTLLKKYKNTQDFI